VNLGVNHGVVGLGGAELLAVVERLLEAQARQSAADRAQQLQLAADALAQQQRLAADALAQQCRVAAGPAPTFSGKQARGVEVHSWVASMERYFASAHMVGAATDAERVVVAAAALRDLAQMWWTALCAPGGAGAPTTWAAFRDAITKQYQPQSPERWAMQQLHELCAKDNRDVAVYTARVLELYQLLPAESELGRVMTYERGLPETFRVKCAEKQHTTLQAATEAMLALWNAKLAAGTVSASRGAAQLHHTQSEGEVGESQQDAGGAGRRAAAAAAATIPAAQGQMDVAQLFAMLTQWDARRAPPKSGSAGDRDGRGRGRTSGKEGERRRSRSGSKPRNPLPDAVFEARMEQGLCFNCGGKDHQGRRCTEKRNEDMPPTN
jgi:hypothetical protein